MQSNINHFFLQFLLIIFNKNGRVHYFRQSASSVKEGLQIINKVKPRVSTLKSTTDISPHEIKTKVVQHEKTFQNTYFLLLHLIHFYNYFLCKWGLFPRSYMDIMNEIVLKIQYLASSSLVLRKFNMGTKASGSLSINIYF